MTLEPREILALPLGDGNRSDAKTVSQYLVRLAQAKDSKKPFGDSDWEAPLIWAFGNEGLIWFVTDGNGMIDDYPQSAFEEVLDGLYDFLFDVDVTTMERKAPPPPPKEWYLVCVDREGNTPGYLTDYFSTPMTEEEAKTHAETHNKAFDYHAWVPVHIPPVS